MRPSILIYGVGGMGNLFKRFFSLRGYYVKGYDILPERSEIEEGEMKNFNVIFLCIPMEEIGSAINHIKSNVPSRETTEKGPLLVDISSVKRGILDVLDYSGFDYLSIHPMMAPDSDIGLSNIIVVRESGREEEKTILKEMENAGAVISRIPPELHDLRMAEIQGISHFILIGIANFLKDRIDDEDLSYSSPIFYALYKLASRIINQDWRMYLRIQKNSEELREEFLRSLENLNNRLRNEKEFETIFRELREVFRDPDGSNLIMDSSRAGRVPEGKIELLRGYIQLIDSLILRLIEKRVSAGRQIAIHKKETGMPIEIADVEDIKLKELTSKSSLNRMILKRIFQDIMELTKEEEYKMLGIKNRLAVLGPMGSFSDDVAVKLTHSRVPLIYCSSVDEIMRLVERDEKVYGLIPIENSVHGTVLKSIDGLMKYNVEVFAETKMDIVHVLAGKRKMSFAEIKVLYSHPQAIAQCSEFINNYLPFAKVRYTTSTSDAISMLDDFSAAIVSESAVEIYNLFMLKKGIQDNQNNTTRFYIIRKKGMQKLGCELDGNTTCLFFGVEDKPGALKRVLEVFSDKNINLRKLESRPSGISLGSYIFYSEVEKRLTDDDLGDLKEVTTFYKVAGVFREVERLEL